MKRKHRRRLTAIGWGAVVLLCLYTMFGKAHGAGGSLMGPHPIKRSTNGDTLKYADGADTLKFIHESSGRWTLLAPEAVRFDSALVKKLLMVFGTDTLFLTSEAGTDGQVLHISQTGDSIYWDVDDGAGGGDNVKADTAGDGTNVVDVTSPVVLQEGTNITLTVINGDTVNIAGPAGSGDDIQVDTGDGSIKVIDPSSPVVFQEGEAIQLDVDANDTVTVAAEDATSANKGVATFNTANFAVTAGDVEIKAAGVDSTELLDVQAEEYIEDNALSALAAVTGTHTGITVNYQDATDDVDLSVTLGTDIVTGEIVDQTIVKADIDSTASNFVFDDAYRGTSAVAGSTLATIAYVDLSGGGGGALFEFDSTGSGGLAADSVVLRQSADIDIRAVTPGDGDRDTLYLDVIDDGHLHTTSTISGLLDADMANDALDPDKIVGDATDDNRLDSNVIAAPVSRAVEDAAGNVISTTYETITNVGKIGDDTVSFKNAASALADSTVDSANALTNEAGKFIAFLGDSIIIADTTAGAQDLHIVGHENLSIHADSVIMGADRVGDITGTGLTVTANALTVTLGTDIDLTSEVTGTLPVGNGGTGAATLTDGGIVLGSGASAVTVSARPASGEILIGQTTGDPLPKSVIGDIGLTESGATVIQANKITEGMLKEVDGTPTDEDILTYEATVGDFQWHTPAELGLLTGNETITLTGDVTGSGATAITTSIGTGVIVDADLGANVIDTSSLAHAPLGELISDSVNGMLTGNTETGITVTGNEDNTIDFVVDLGTDIDLTTEVTGTLPVGNGGTGAATLTDGGILLGSGTGAVTALGVATNGQIPIGDGTTDPVLGTISGGTGLTVTNGVGTISIAHDAHTGDVTGATGLTIASNVIDSANIAAKSISLSDIEGQNWKVYYSNGTGVVTPLALGASGEVLKSNGATSAPTFQTDGGSPLFDTNYVKLTTATLSVGGDDITEFAPFGGAMEVNAGNYRIASSGITESMLGINNSPTDEYFLTYESGGLWDFEWHSLAEMGAVDTASHRDTNDILRVEMGDTARDILSDASLDGIEVTGFMNVQGAINQQNWAQRINNQFAYIIAADTFIQGLPIHNVGTTTPQNGVFDSNYWRGDSIFQTVADIGDSSTKDSLWVINSDTMGIALHHSNNYLPQGYGDSSHVKFRDLMAYTPFYRASNDENPHLAVSNDNGHTWTETIDSSNGGTPSDVIPNPIWTPTTLNALGDFTNVNFLSDVDGFLDRNGKYWMIFRVKYTVAVNPEIVITGSDNLITWSNPVRIIDSTQNDSDLVSPAIWMDTAGVYRLIAPSINVNPHRFHIYELNRNAPDSLFTKVTSVRVNSPIAGKDWWHMEVIPRNGDELVGLFMMSDSASSGGLNSRGLLGFSYDKGLTWTNFNTEFLVDSMSQFVPTAASATYRMGGYMINTGGGDALQVYFAAQDTGISSAAKFIVGSKSEEWRTIRAQIGFDPPPDEKRPLERFSFSDFQVLGYPDTASANGTITLGFTFLSSGRLLSPLFRVIADKFGLDTAITPALSMIAPQDMVAESLRVVFRNNSATPGQTCRWDSIVYFAPKPDTSSTIWDNKTIAFSRKGVVAFGTRAATATIPKDTTFTIGQELRRSDQMVFKFYLSSGGNASGSFLADLLSAAVIGRKLYGEATP